MTPLPTSETPPVATLRKVEWCNVWNYAGGLHGDGYGSKTHITTAPGRSGKTLCGKHFPAEKGYPSSGGTCKRCWKKAQQMGLTRESYRALDYVANSTTDW